MKRSFIIANLDISTCGYVLSIVIDYQRVRSALLSETKQLRISDGV